ncbi:MAG: phosphoribosylanthranilate isomerase [Desulfovibrionaceae bacterium]|nr:phosphoribosylanthranilate isomerase [Desulfovibrionaceae bacterium]
MKIKICGLTRSLDVELALNLGADLAGFIFHKPSPRYVEASAVRQFYSGAMQRVGVFIEKDLDKILEVVKLAKLDLIQLHGDQPEEVAQKLGASRVIRVIWPDRYKSLSELQAHLLAHPHCAYYLFDAGKNLGGSGTSFAWEKIHAIETPHPWWLAGGLKAENVTQALSYLHPYGLDLNSGVEVSPGIKSQAKMEEMFSLISRFKSKLN